MSDVYFRLSNGIFSQDWSDVAALSANNDWSGVQSIVGFRGDGLTANSTTDPQTVTASSAVTTVNLIANQTNPNTLNTGGIAEFDTLADPVVALQGSGTARAPYLAFYFDSTGQKDITFSFVARDVDGSADSSVQQIAVQYRTDPNGPWINLPAGYVADASTGGTATKRTDVVVTLPAAANNQPTLQVRVITTDAVGSDEWIGIDDIRVTSVAIAADTRPGTLSIADAALVEGNAGTSEMVFTVTRADGSTGAVSATYAVSLDGTAAAGDLGAALTGTVSFAAGQTSATIRVPVAGDTQFEGNETFSVLLSNPTGGASLGRAAATGTITNDDAPPLPGTLSIADAAVAEGDAGTSLLTFVVTRANGSEGAVSADYAVLLNGTASAADLGTPLTGTVSFANGQTSATVSIPVVGDLAIEGNETFTVQLSNPGGGVSIGKASATGTITNDDLPPLANVWINEFHYDNAGADLGEFVEVAGLAGIDLTGWTLVLYNGGDGKSYGAPIALKGTLGDSTNGFGFASVPATGLQNGAPDGIALVDNYGRVVQFLSYEGSFAAVNGPAAGRTSADIGVEQNSAAAGTSLQLVGTGSSYGDFTWTVGSAATGGVANGGQQFLGGTDQGQIRIDDAAVVEGTGGTSTLVFTVHRAGGFATAATADWSVALDGGADLADLLPGAVLSGTVSFAAGEFVKTITLPVAADAVGELNEKLSVTLGAVTGNAVLVDGAAVGTIVNDDLLTLTIPQIQGEGHRSAYVGQPIETAGIVTAVDKSGFWIQDATGDGNARTSDAVFVYTQTAPAVAVGDAVTVRGTVDEFQSGANNLTLTEIVAPTVTVTSSGNALPASVLIGTGGLLPPTENLDSDGLTVFNPEADGLDFWESLEGMRVTVDSPIAVSNSTTFGETDIVASGGLGATGINARGGITVSAGDFNPERLQLDDRLSVQPLLSQGDRLASVDGILSYSFGRYELLATATATVTEDRTLGDNDTLLVGDANHLSIATYNLENLDPSDNKYELLAHDIVYSLKAPDIIAIQEVQDADGAGNGTNLSGVSNVQGLIDAIRATTGIVYTYVEIAPTVAGSTGGEPGGNIRSGYLYQAERVDLVEGSLLALADSAFNGSRKPLVATWSFNGQEVTTVNVHFTSRGGSTPLMGDVQPPVDAGDAARTAQAKAVGDYVFDIISKDSAKQFVLLGDWNGFQFEAAQTQLTKGGVFTNLSTLLPEEERYSYVFEGNAQLIDNMLVTGGLFANARYDAVHINAEFSGARPTDHDPQVALLRIAITPHDVVLAGGAVDENLPAGTMVGTLSATDTPGDTLTFALIDDADGRFVVDPATGVVRTARPLDYEEATSFALVVKVTDSAGLSSQNAVTVTVGDVNEAPVAAGDTLAVDEDATSDNLWSLLLGNDRDVDAGDRLTISAVNGAGTLGSLLFDPASQTLRYVADNDAFDSLATGATAIDSFTYTVTDKAGLSSTATVSVAVKGIADGVTIVRGNGNDLVVGTGGEDVLSGGNGNDELSGLDGHDAIDGGAGNDRLFGGTGNDVLLGGSGNDRVEGGAGNDLVIGGGGDDELIGGAGRDGFVFASRSGNDVIRDFDLSADRLVLEGNAIRSAQTLDWDGDGRADLRLSLTGGGSVTLLGVAALDGVKVETTTDPASGYALLEGRLADHATFHVDGWLIV